MQFTCVLMMLFFFAQLQATENERDFNVLLESDDFDFRYECGMSRVDYSQKDEFVTVVCKHFGIVRCFAQIDQLRMVSPFWMSYNV